MQRPSPAELVQVFAWCAVFVLSVLIVASRKHYTVDVLIAWYVVPLVFYAMLRRWTTRRPVNEEPWPHRSLAEDNALQLEEIVVHCSMAAPEVSQSSNSQELKCTTVSLGSYCIIACRFKVHLIVRIRPQQSSGLVVQTAGMLSLHLHCSCMYASCFGCCSGACPAMS